MIKYFPIGTVVAIKDRIENVMITGYYGRDFNQEVKVCDYVGVAYPNGKEKLCFNHSDINAVYHMGLENSDYARLNEELMVGRETKEEVETEVVADMPVDIETVQDQEIPSELMSDGVKQESVMTNLDDLVSDFKFTMNYGGSVTEEETEEAMELPDLDLSMIGIAETPKSGEVKYEFNEQGEVIAEHL